MARLEKGGCGPLNVTQQAHWRVLAGLGWDPNEKAGMLAKARQMAGGKKTWHDLDLSCFLYDAAGNFLESVTAANENASNSSGHVYHSGDNVEGLGDGDDEEISVELKDLPANIRHVIFVTTIKSGHSFSEVDSPEIRLADAYSGHDFLSVPLRQDESKGKSAFVFARIWREGENWMIHNISDFLNAGEIRAWPEYLKKYLKA
jgi:stress response protein SCP2